MPNQRPQQAGDERVTKAIGEVKKAILKGSARDTPVRHPAAVHAHGG